MESNTPTKPTISPEFIFKNKNSIDSKTFYRVADSILKEVPVYDMESDLEKVRDWVRRIREWDEYVARFNYYGENEIWIFLKSKMGLQFRENLRAYMERERDCTMLTPEEVCSWLEKEKAVVHDSDDARAELRVIRMFKLKITVSQLYDAMIKINVRINHYDRKELDLIELFIRALDRNIAGLVGAWYDEKKDELLLTGDKPLTIIQVRNYAIIQERHVIKPTSSEAGIKKINAVRSAATIKGTVTETEWNEKYQRARLAEWTGLREYLIRLKRCLYCRQTTCVGATAGAKCPQAPTERKRFIFNTSIK